MCLSVPKVKIRAERDYFDFSTFQIWSPGRKGDLISPHPYPPSPTEVLSLLCWGNPSMTKVGMSLCAETVSSIFTPLGSFCSSIWKSESSHICLSSQQLDTTVNFFVCFWNVFFGRYRVSFHFLHCPCIGISSWTICPWARGAPVEKGSVTSG